VVSLRGIGEVTSNAELSQNYFDHLLDVFSTIHILEHGNEKLKTKDSGDKMVITSTI
jgi:hypothetical protein